MFTLIAFLQAKPEKREPLLAVLKGLIAPSRENVHCVDFHLHESQSDPCLFVFYENWSSKSDFDAHGSMAELQSFWEARMDYLTQEITIHFLNMLSPYPAK